MPLALADARQSWGVRSGPVLSKATTYWPLNHIQPASGGAVYYQFSDAGDPISITDGNNNTTGFGYDGIHRLTSITYPDLGAGAKSVSMDWECCGPRSITDENGYQLG